MLRLRIKTKTEAHDVDFPQSWSELTWDQGYRLSTLKAEQLKSYAEIISILTGLSVKFWREYTDLKQYQILVDECSWVHDVDAAKEMHEKAFHKFTLDGKTYQLPSDVGNFPVGLFEDAKQLAGTMFAYLKEASEGEHVESSTFLTDTATLFKMYFQYVRDGEYRASTVRDIDIDNIPFYIVVRWRDFFLMNIVASQSGTRKDFDKYRSQGTRWQRAISKLAKILGLRSRYTRSRRGILEEKILS